MEEVKLLASLLSKLGGGSLPARLKKVLPKVQQAFLSHILQ